VKKQFCKRRIFRASLGFDLSPGCLLRHRRHLWSGTFDSALTMTFGDRIRMIGGAVTNGDTIGWATALVGVQLSWATIHDESRYRTAVWRALAGSCIPGARRGRPGSGRSRPERGLPAQATPVWCS
jgi:hypothetical protein